MAGKGTTLTHRPVKRYSCGCSEKWRANVKKETGMQFTLTVVPSEEKEGHSGNGGKIYFLALKDGIFLVGRSRHAGLWDSFCNISGRAKDVSPGLFAAGSCSGGKLDFSCTDFGHKTPNYDQACIAEYLAGQALNFAVTAQEERVRFAMGAAKLAASGAIGLYRR